MLGSRALPPGLPSLPSLTLRVTLVCALVLIPLHVWRRPLIEPLLPAYATCIRLLAPEFSINSAEVMASDSSQVVRVRANLSAPLEYAGQTLIPFGWNGVPQGGFQVILTLGGLLEYSAAFLIVILAWPSGNVREFLVRGALAIPALLVIVLAEAPLTVVAELWNALRDNFNPHGPCGWMVFSRFLMGGGGLVLAIFTGALIIGGSKRLLSPGPLPEPGRRRNGRNPNGNACLVIPRREPGSAGTTPHS
jgi:hypothetical protein